jgi:hypothetical protein
MGRTPGRLVLFAVGLMFFGLFAGAKASAQTASPTTTPAASRDCSDFQNQQEAQAFYDQHKNDNPDDPDPFDLDADGDGTACEGLPGAAAAGTSPTPAPSSNSLPKNGVETGVLALSGFSLHEAGIGLNLLSRKFGLKRRQVPVKLMRMLVHAGNEGKTEVALGDDVYLVRRSAVTTTDEIEPAPEEFEPALDEFEEPPVISTPVTGGSVYAAIVRQERTEPELPEESEEPTL